MEVGKRYNPSISMRKVTRIEVAVKRVLGNIHQTVDHYYTLY